MAAAFLPAVFSAGSKLVVVNAASIRLSKRLLSKRYWWHTGYPGGARFKTASRLSAGCLFKRVLAGMLPACVPARWLARGVILCSVDHLNRLPARLEFVNV
ncbi:putative 50S ribosomal subunit protein L13 [Candidatus Hodgkinia cicadicola Dsem]|nr:putative 50S ribosomal subunit protein L13 [Candidatus Hodgkinia cicadicola Dsem]